MLSIASWRSAASKEREAEPVERVVRREAPKPEKPAPSVAPQRVAPPPPMPAVDGDHRGAAATCVRHSIDHRAHALALWRRGDARQYFRDRSSGRIQNAAEDWQLCQSALRGRARSSTGGGPGRPYLRRVHGVQRGPLQHRHRVQSTHRPRLVVPEPRRQQACPGCSGRHAGAVRARQPR